MLDLFNISKPQGCDIQIFYGGTNVAGTISDRSWAKPRGVSHVYMMLIGAGGNGDLTNGGGSGAVTVWYGAAQHVPDSLLIMIGRAADGSYVASRQRNGLNYLIQANAGTTAAGGAGTASAPGPFAASGFYQSIAGQTGGTTRPSASPTTFLSCGGSSGGVEANYGYETKGTNEPGSFRMQPIIVGSGGSSNSGVKIGGIGCGGGADANSPGGQGMVLIASW